MRAQIRRLTALLAAPLLLASGVVPAIEIGVSTGLSNLDFNADRVSTDLTLQGDSLRWVVGAFVRQELGDDLSITLDYSSDPVLRNVAYARMNYAHDFFSVEIGPFFGILNGGTLVQSGLSTTVSLFVPGVALARLRSDTSLNGRLVVAGDYIQEQSELAVGFYAPNALPVVYVRTRRYTYKTSSGENVDEQTSYGLETSVFQKNVPYRVALDFSYLAGSRSFVEGAVTTVHGYGALIVGTDVSVAVLPELRVFIELDSGIYLFGTDELLGSVRADRYLYRLNGGVSWSF